MNKKWILAVILVLMLSGTALVLAVKAQERVGAVATKVIKVDRGMSALDRKCIECHQDTSPSIVLDWKNSMHGRSGITCSDCHRANRGNPMPFSAPDSRGPICS